MGLKVQWLERRCFRSSRRRKRRSDNRQEIWRERDVRRSVSRKVDKRADDAEMEGVRARARNEPVDCISKVEAV